jgi:hypothetical protein
MHILPEEIKPTEIIAGAIAVFENVWKDYEETIKEIEDVTNTDGSGVFFIPAKTNGDLININPDAQSLRTNFNLSLTESGTINESFRKINNRYSELVQTLIGGYVNNFGIDEQIFDTEPYVLLKYNGGQKYDAHYDGGSASKRCVSIILYLNDDYTGGELEFVNFGIKVKPKAGTFYVFPSGYAYRHIAHPVESGTKYAIVTWMHDME